MSRPAGTTDWAAAVARYRAALPPGRSGDVDISGADRVGLPVVSADHTGPDGLRYYGFGYGAVPDQARTGGYGELVEELLLHHHLQALAPRRGSYRELRGELGADRVADPLTLVLPAGTDYTEDRPLDWLPTVRWRTGEQVWVPAEFCGAEEADLPWQRPEDRLITVITNGCGAGDTAERAVAHALGEILQRDGNSTTFRAMDQGVVIDLDAVTDPVALDALARLRAAGVEPVAKLASTQFGMTDLHVVGTDADPDAPPLVVTACGEAAHPDREVALRKALLEFAAARSRKVFSHAPLDQVRPLAPDDYWERELSVPVAPQEPRALEAMRDWAGRSAAELAALLEPTVLSRRSSVAFSALPTVAPGAVDDQPALLADLLARLADFDVLAIVVPAGDAVAAKVVVPRTEVETMSYGRIGERGVAKLIERDSPLVGIGPPPRPGTAPVLLPDDARDRLGGPAWLDVAAVRRTVGGLYPLYREPARHALARLVPA